MKRILLAMFAVILAMTASAADDLPALRKKAEQLQRDGNYKEAYEAYRALVFNKDNNPTLAANDLSTGIQMLQNCNRVEEIDAFREDAVAANPANWMLLQKAACSLIDNSQWGYIVNGEFKRGNHRGDGRYVSSIERDRIRAMQLMAQGLPIVTKVGGSWLTAQYYQELARIILHSRSDQGAWRLQYLSDLTSLPDYDEQRYGQGDSGRGAPVNADGTPVYYKVAKEWTDAFNDGERYRWCLLHVMEIDADNRNQALFQWAQFMQAQFGVQTLAVYGSFFSDPDDDTRTDESGTYALHTLGEDETIARMATGVKRFKLPDEHNFIRLFKTIADSGSNRSYRDSSLETLASIFEDRRQYPKAAEYWKRVIREFGPGNENYRQKRLDQILKNWGRFEPVMTQPAGQGATVEFRFRNADEVRFEAYAVKINQLLDDVKDYIKSDPKQLDWDKINIGDIGYRIVERDEKKYMGKRVAEWTLPLKPLPNHFDRRITVTTPLQKAGVYLLKATTKNGNLSQIIMWVDDTAIIKKPLSNGTYMFVADAVSGSPLPKATLSFFGYRQNWVQGSKRYKIDTQEFAEFTDADGQCIRKNNFGGNYQWIIIATTPDGRMAHLGFTGLWHGNYYDQEYNQTKVYLITDRPVYRPDQPVKYKFWVATAHYDKEGASSFANQEFIIEAHDPQGTKIFETTLTSDEFGGMGGEFTLTKDAKLGVCQLLLKCNDSYLGSGSFRVEEYKKPEFEVKVTAPDEPAMLGEKIPVKVEAKYYFGAPVTKAKATFKINRFSHRANWYPMGRWDWFYGRGYWWFAYDYIWYPGWHDWGCRRPIMWWWPSSPTPPELVADSQLELKPDGTATIMIDTALAKAMHADTDHRYEITVEITDESRRTIVGSSSILVARKPFKVYAWVDRGHYRVGDVIQTEFQAQTIDGKPVQGKGKLRLLKIGYDKENKPIETEVRDWKLDTDDQGSAHLQIKASEGGQYRLSYKLRDSKRHMIEGGYVFTVMGAGMEASQFRFNNLELVPDQREYAPGGKVQCRINTDRADSTVVLFLRPVNGAYLPPKVLRLRGKSTRETIEVVKKDMPNFFIEAFTVSNGKVFTETREVVVPPEKRVFNIAVTPDAASYKPGAKAKVNVTLTDIDGKPVRGSTVMTIYDKALEYISGGSNVPEIKTFFWKWRRSHRAAHESSLERMFHNLVAHRELSMNSLGAFGEMVADESSKGEDRSESNARSLAFRGGGKQDGMMVARTPRPATAMKMMAAAPASAEAEMSDSFSAAGTGKDSGGMASDEPGDSQTGTTPNVQPMIRTKFADNAYWNAFLNTDSNGVADVEFTMPENLTGWKIKSWAMGRGTRVGEAEAAVVTVKNLLLRLQAPRFFTEKDEVILSANVHNYLKNKKQVTVILELDGLCLKPMDKLTRKITVDAKGEERVDWRVKAVKEGEAVIRMKALTDEESDAMEMRFPVQVHGMLKTVSYSGAIRPDMNSAKIKLDVPAERRIDQSVLEIRYSPTLAGAMVDALPYLLEYPYGCTEQVLSRFLPAVITQKILIDMGLDLKTIKAKRANLNAQEIGDDTARAAQWKRFKSEPVFDHEIMTDIVKEGVKQMTAMQCADGGWGWFSGYGEYSYPHTTAYVVHGMHMAIANDVALVPGILERGVAWLQNYQDEQVRMLKNGRSQTKPWKQSADDLDAFVFMVATDAGVKNGDMMEFLYRDRTRLAVYSKSMFGMALHKLGEKEKLDMIIRNIEQYLVQDEENQTAYLKLDNGYCWWYWYGSEFEAHAYYLKLLAKTDPTGVKASRLVKYLLNNRKHATYWNSTRDTALCIEALADYLRASKEDKPDMTVEILVDGKKMKEVKITGDNLFSFDNKFIMLGDALEDGTHTVEFRKKGTGPLYFNAYLSNFTLEDFITRAGLEVKVTRKIYKLIKSDKSIKVEGVRGQALDQKVEKYERAELDNNAMLKSGDLVEVELSIESKNDYEYLIFEDMKAAGFEAVEVRSGYNGNDMGAYVEFRDNRVCFFVRSLARGQHSVAYRLRAEIPGTFSALPTRAWAMYAPELKANSDEIKLKIED